MSTHSMKRYEIHLGATLLTTAKMIVEATSEQEARDYADVNYQEADWNGADYERPQGCDIEIISIEEKR